MLARLMAHIAVVPSTAVNMSLGRKALSVGNFKEAAKLMSRCVKLATSGSFGTGPTTRAARGVSLGAVLALRASARTGLMQYAEVGCTALAFPCCSSEAAPLTT